MASLLCRHAAADPADGAALPDLVGVRREASAAGATLASGFGADDAGSAQFLAFSVDGEARVASRVHVGGAFGGGTVDWGSHTDSFRSNLALHVRASSHRERVHGAVLGRVWLPTASWVDLEQYESAVLAALAAIHSPYEPGRFALHSFTPSVVATAELGGRHARVQGEAGTDLVLPTGGAAGLRRELVVRGSIAPGVRIGAVGMHVSVKALICVTCGERPLQLPLRRGIWVAPGIDGTWEPVTFGVEIQKALDVDPERVHSSFDVEPWPTVRLYVELRFY